MRYIGGKTLMLDSILKVVDTEMKRVRSVVDIFSGSGVVGGAFKASGRSVLMNDFLYFCYVLARGAAGLDEEPRFSRLHFDPFEYLNALTLERSEHTLEECFVYNSYSPNENCSRMYFRKENAIKIDVVRMKIEDWKNAGLLNDDEYYYLLASLINAVPYVSNITGVYAAYLKFWDKRTFAPLRLKRHPVISSRHPTRCVNLDYTKVLSESCDLLYADPPYNSRQYLPNYHALETIALYDRPKLRGVSGMRDYENQKSDFCRKSHVLKAFETLLRDCGSEYVLISYNNEGLAKTGDLIELCQDYAVSGTFKLFDFDYRRYKNKIPNNKPGLKEQLYFLRRAQ